MLLLVVMWNSKREDSGFFAIRSTFVVKIDHMRLEL